LCSGTALRGAASTPAWHTRLVEIPRDGVVVSDRFSCAYRRHSVRELEEAVAETWTGDERGKGR